MARSAAYQPVQGYRFQILTRNLSYGRAFEHCDYAKDRDELNHLRREYAMAYGPGWEFRTITLPAKYWPHTVAR